MSKIPVSPLALPLPELPPVAGVRLATAEAGIRYKGRTDVLLAEFAEGTTVAGVFTKNLCPGAPVTWCREALDGGVARGLVVNAGNANVFNGLAGVRAVGGKDVAIHTFSFVAEGSDVDETPFIELAAASAGAQSASVRIKPDEIVAEMAAAHAKGLDVARVHSGDPSLYGAIAAALRATA